MFVVLVMQVLADHLRESPLTIEHLFPRRFRVTMLKVVESAVLKFFLKLALMAALVLYFYLVRNLVMYV